MIHAQRRATRRGRLKDELARRRNFPRLNGTRMVGFSRMERSKKDQED